MQGDKVILQTTSEEIDGDTIFSTKLSEKPQFMLQEEYNSLVIKIAVESLKIAVKTVYPNNTGTQKVLAEAIASRVGD